MKEDIITSILAELALIIGTVIISSVLLVVWQKSILEDPLSFLVSGIAFVIIYTVAKFSLSLRDKKQKKQKTQFS